MNNKYYKLFGKINLDIVHLLKDQVVTQQIADKNYQWVYANENIKQIFNSLISNDFPFEVVAQKAFVSKPGYGWRIHKDGINCKAAINIVLSCNSQDWVRWYDESMINNIGKLKILNNIKKSRDINIIKYEEVQYSEELKNEIGDIYVLNVDEYHSFKCMGTATRIVLQTKFTNNPSFEDLCSAISSKHLNNINYIKNE